MRQCLWEIADLACSADVIFLRQQTNVVGDAHDPIE